MAGSEAFKSNRRWLKAGFSGNAPLPDEAIRVQIDRLGSTSGEAWVGLSWTNSAGRARSRNRKPPLDEQIAAALEKGSPKAALSQAVAADPRGWLKGGKAVDLPGWRFARTVAEICYDCRGFRTHACSACSETGRVDCWNCSRTGRAEVNCWRCHGHGQYSEVRSFQQWNGTQYMPQYETVWHPCFNCGQTGKVMDTCPSCRGSLKAACGSCNGRGRIRCSTCRGSGKIESESQKWLQAVSRVDLAFNDIPSLKHRELLQQNWTSLVEAGDVAIKLAGSSREIADLEIRQPFSAEVQLCTIEVTLPGDRAGSVESVGSRRPVRSSTPLLAEALGISPEMSGDSALDRLAGKRILAQATGAVRAARRARRDPLVAARAKVQADYSVMIGASDKVVAAAAVVADAEGRPWARRIWPVGLGLSTLLGALAAYLTAAAWRPDNPVDPERLGLLLAAIGLGTLMLAWGLLWFRLVPRGKSLAVVRAPAPPALDSTLGWGMAVVLAPFVATVAVGFAAYLADWPTGRTAPSTDAQALAVGVGQAVTTTGVRLRSGPGTEFDVLVTLPEGQHVILLEGGDGDWANVRHDGQDGYIARRYLLSETKP